MNILVVDVGGTAVKILATGQEERRKVPSGPTLAAEQMVTRVKRLAGDWPYDVVSIGYPGFVMRGRPVAEPHNLAHGWVGFDFQAAFGCPVAAEPATTPMRSWEVSVCGRSLPIGRR
jgi:predicted NBD/HSP70 family sugar kinase